MQRSVAAAASVLLGASLASAPVLAGDRALIDFIGFSEDGHYFAFEEFGEQDGSGFPFSNIYVVDLQADEWVAGTPVRIRIDDDTATVASARGRAAAGAAAHVKKFGIDTPVDIVAMNADGEPGNGTDLTFGMPGYFPNDPIGRATLTLSTFPADSPEPCADYIGERARGFILTLVDETGTREVHRDSVLPRSRGCPSVYRIFAVVSPPFFRPPQGYVAIIASYPFGFEGPDRRFIAVPLEP